MAKRSTGPRAAVNTGGRLVTRVGSSRRRRRPAMARTLGISSSRRCWSTAGTLPIWAFTA